MKVLNDEQIRQKIRRLAIEILEHNYDEKEIVLLGMNNTGYSFGELLKLEMDKIYPGKLVLRRIKLNPKAPHKEEALVEGGSAELRSKVVILVDDVANTGRTLFYAFKPLLDILPKKVEVAVLVNRKHKHFPVKVDFLGLELATTVKETIAVDIRTKDNFAVTLE